MGRKIGQIFQYPKIQKLLKKRRITPLELEDVVLKILKVAFLTTTQLSLEEICGEPFDDMVISCAVEGEADFIISGDQDLTSLESYQGIKIVAPAAFLKLIEEAG